MFAPENIVFLEIGTPSEESAIGDNTRALAARMLQPMLVDLIANWHDDDCELLFEFIAR